MCIADSCQIFWPVLMLRKVIFCSFEQPALLTVSRVHFFDFYTHTHTHTHVYIYMCMCMCVCVCVCVTGGVRGGAVG